MLDFNTASPLRAVDPIAWEARLERLRATLTAKTPEMVRDVFPRARHHGNEARIGDVDGAPGESLNINLTTGEWYDHATGEGGDLIKLWQVTQGYTQGEFAKAVDDLECWAGLSQKPKWTSPVAKTAERRQKEAQEQPAPEYQGLGAPTAIWHYYDAEGRIHSAQQRYELANGEKDYRPKCFRDGKWVTGAPVQRILYRLPQIAGASHIVLVEGEKSADALANLGVEATTAMGGANAPIDKTDWSPLRGKVVTLWPDNDAPGFAHMERVKTELQRLGIAVSEITLPPGKPEKWDAADAVAEEADVVSILGTAETPPQPRPQPLRFRILSVDELFDIKAPEWRIDGIFPTHGSSTVYGAYESFKTFVALDMLLCLAAGKDWFGRDAKSCPVLYIAGEGQHGIAQRVYGWKEAHLKGESPHRFRALPESVAIPSGGDLDDLLRAIEAMPEPPGVIALDTITRMSGGGSLNDEKDMQAYVRGMDRLRLVTGAHIMNIGHTGKDKDKGLLGSIVLPAAMETIICVERTKDNLKLVNANPKGKQKDGPNFEDIRLVTRKSPFERFGVAYQTLILMPDEDVVRDDEEVVTGRSERPIKAHGANQIAVLAALKKAKGEPLGLTRLAAMARLDNSKVAQAIAPLVAKGIAIETGSEGGKRWTLA